MDGGEALSALAGSGAVAAVHVPLASVPIIPWGWPVRSVYVPTATQDPADAHETADNDGLLPPAGIGASAAVHVPLLSVSMSGSWSLLLSVYSPTATHEVAEAHEIESRPGLVAPAGSGASVAVHVPPLSVSITRASALRDPACFS